MSKSSRHPDALGDRMKDYENAFRVTLPRRLPVIVRIDGIAWHTLTRNADRPFDESIGRLTRATMLHCAERMQGCVFAYTQSDEISFLLHNYKQLQSEPWLSNGLQKIVSHAAALASSFASCDSLGERVTFDARAFVLPEAEVCNYFIWRQQDATRNAIQMAARAHFSHKECDHKNGSELQEMLFARGVNFNDYHTKYRRGSAATRETYTLTDIDEHNVAADVVRHRWVCDDEMPILTADRAYVERHLAVDGEP